jgi:hypothetical protein
MQDMLRSIANMDMTRKPSPRVKQVWVKKDETIHPMRGNERTYQEKVFMPRIRFLILRHQVWLLALLLVIFVCLLCNWGTSLLCPLFSWESIAGTCGGRQKSRSSDCFSVLASLSLGRICRIFFLLAYQIIACIFSWYLNSLGINLLCLDIIESFWL